MATSTIKHTLPVAPVVESVTLTLSPDEARVLHSVLNCNSGQFGCSEPGRLVQGIVKTLSKHTVVEGGPLSYIPSDRLLETYLKFKPGVTL